MHGLFLVDSFVAFHIFEGQMVSQPLHLLLCEGLVQELRRPPDHRGQVPLHFLKSDKENVGLLSPGPVAKHVGDEGGVISTNILDKCIEKYIKRP